MVPSVRPASCLSVSAHGSSMPEPQVTPVTQRSLDAWDLRYTFESGKLAFLRSIHSRSSSSFASSIGGGS